MTTPTPTPTPDRSPNEQRNLGDFQVVEALTRVPATKEREFQIVVVKAVPGTSSANMYVCLADAEATSGYAWSSIVGAGLKASGGGQFFLPTGPSAGTAVASGTTDTYGSWVEFDAVVAAALYVVGVLVRDISTLAAYVQVDIGVGEAASEVSVGEAAKFSGSSGNTEILNLTHPQAPISPWIPIATGVRLAVRTADNEATNNAWPVTLICILQSDVVGI